MKNWTASPTDKIPLQSPFSSDPRTEDFPILSELNQADWVLIPA
jgi:hypothetical protein